MQKRTERLFLRLSKEDGEYFIDCAKESGLSLTKYLILLSKTSVKHKGIDYAELEVLLFRLSLLRRLITLGETDAYSSQGCDIVSNEVVVLDEILTEIINVVEIKKMSTDKVSDRVTNKKTDTKQLAEFNFKLSKEEREVIVAGAYDAMLTMTEFITEVMYDREVRSRKKIMIINEIRVILRNIVCNMSMLSEAFLDGFFYCENEKIVIADIEKKLLKVLEDIFYLLE